MESAMANQARVEDSTVLRLIWRHVKWEGVSIKMTLEARLVRAYLALRNKADKSHDLKFVLLARYGAYEVRLVEPPDDRFEFWLELIDLDGNISIDGGGANDLEDALAIAEEFVSSAQDLSKNRLV
jgi:hypothetical protein